MINKREIKQGGLFFLHVFGLCRKREAWCVFIPRAPSPPTSNNGLFFATEFRWSAAQGGGSLGVGTGDTWTADPARGRRVFVRKGPAYLESLFPGCHGNARRLTFASETAITSQSSGSPIKMFWGPAPSQILSARVGESSRGIRTLNPARLLAPPANAEP